MRQLLFFLLLSLISTSLVSAECWERPCGKAGFDSRGKPPLCVKCAPPVDEVYFTNITNHIAVVVDSTIPRKCGEKTQLEVQKEYFNRLGFGPWKQPSVMVNYPAVYCGRPTPLNVTIHLNTNRDYDNGQAFTEIFELTDKSKNFFRDWYDVHGSTIIYRGLMIRQGPDGKLVMTAEQFENFAREQGLDIVFHMPGCPKNAYFFYDGYILNEVVFPC